MNSETLCARRRDSERFTDWRRPLVAPDAPLLDISANPLPRPLLRWPEPSPSPRGDGQDVSLAQGGHHLRSQTDLFPSTLNDAFPRLTALSTEQAGSVMAMPIGVQAKVDLISEEPIASLHPH